MTHASVVAKHVQRTKDKHSWYENVGEGGNSISHIFHKPEHRLSLKNNHPVSIFRLWMEKLPFPGINLTKQEAEPLFPAAFNSAKPVNS